jgi:hypothetical protein
MQDFNSSYSYWKDGISVKDAAYLYIGGLKVKALRADLMTNWQTYKYESLLTLHNDVAKNSVWCSAAVNIQKKKIPLLLKTRVRHLCRCHRTNVLTAELVEAVMAVTTILEVTETCAFGSKLTWGPLKDAKADFKSPLKSYNSDKKVKHEKATSGSKSYDLWNKAKAKLTQDEFNKRRRTNACINCGEVGLKFSNCPKPTP